jgi:hypothetical protein
MPRLRNETFGTGDQSWLGSTRGVTTARTETVDPTAFTAGTHYPNGYLPSGTAVAKVGGYLVPYDKTEATTTGAGVLAGFIVTDQPVVGTAKFAVPLLDTGRVKSAKVPNSFVAPVAAAKRAAANFVFI